MNAATAGATQLQRRQSLPLDDVRGHALAEHLPHLVWIADQRGTLQYCNARWRDYTGSLATGHFSTPMHADDREHAVQALIAAGAARLEFGVEVRLRRVLDGAYRWHQMRAHPMFDTHGQVLRWYGTSTDIDDQRSAQESLREAHARTNQFLATLGHELRNPVAALVANAELIGHAVAGKSRRHDIARSIGRQAWHLKKLTDDLLDVSRIALGKIHLAVSIVDLSAICRDASDDFGAMARDLGIALEIDVPAAPVLACADATRIRQCVDNLLSNAIKASAAGMVVRQSVRVHDGVAEIVVSDQGVGIDAELCTRVFLAHAQADDWRTRGLGLGLSIVNQLVMLHGGSAWVESLGRNLGATFGIRLPLAACGSTPAQVPACPPVRPVSATVRLRAKVLIVDDQIENAMALQILLGLEGHEVHVAANGPAALAVSDTITPDVVICDLGLPPPMHGLDLARQLRAQYGPAVHLCAYSGHGCNEDVARALAAGFDAHLTKPAMTKTILGEVQRGLQRLLMRANQP